MKINWLEAVQNRREQIIEETQDFLRIDSVLDESTASQSRPFGEGIARALEHLLTKGEKLHFFVKNMDGYAGVIEYGQGEESVGILCHIDVVPAGEGWTSPPFSAEIRDNRIYARGAIDNKGPTIAAFWALQLVKELQLPIHKRVRMIIGTDEESNWRCVDHYFKQEEMPTVGFAPDADFPIIHAEKGIMDVTFNWEDKKGETDAAIKVMSFNAGERFNMVPDRAEVTITGQRQQLDEIETQYQAYLLEHNHNGQAQFKDKSLQLSYEGISAHGSTPENGLNAGVYLAQFLLQFSYQPSANEFLHRINHYCDFTGEALQIAVSDDVSGALSMNAGLFQFKENGEAIMGLNIRYPVTTSGEECINKLRQLAKEWDARFEVLDHMGPNYVEKDHPLIQTLQAVYQRQTGEEAHLLAIGGGTYARSLKTGVAFGPMFPGREDVAHKKDEYIDIDDLIKMTALYAEAIYELAKG
ncbi:dipeptidase PepV [Halalkalibacter alkalisediminis]|uniref:Dipeptidase PepV n=1 Tax=Halalkalibacter alkalisediminis TaxID=935616 RepID=A0ABV6NMN6_9BACI|nr:dipeptidase PepV [Halalkalibacter alkalisediminis]